MAPWLQEGPRVFRDLSGGEGFKSEGRVEDMVLPGEFFGSSVGERGAWRSEGMGGDVWKG